MGSANPMRISQRSEYGAAGTRFAGRPHPARTPEIYERPPLLGGVKSPEPRFFLPDHLDAVVGGLGDPVALDHGCRDRRLEIGVGEQWRGRVL